MKIWKIKFQQNQTVLRLHHFKMNFFLLCQIKSKLFAENGRLYMASFKVNKNFNCSWPFSSKEFFRVNTGYQMDIRYIMKISTRTYPIGHLQFRTCLPRFLSIEEVVRSKN